MGLLRRLDVIVLVVMLLRVIAIIGHVVYRYISIRRSPATDTNSLKALAAELSQRAYILKSIIHTAPFLGLAGSCIGIFDSFTGVAMQKAAAMALINLNLSRAPITTAAAILVTVPAIWCHNCLRTLLDLLKIEISESAHDKPRQRKRSVGVAQSLPLNKQFSGLPSSAVTVAPCLALVLAGFITFSSFDIPRGLPVGLLGPGGRPARAEYFTTDPVVITIATGADGTPVLFVDSKRTPWEQLRTTVQDELKMRKSRVAYVEAECGVRWMDVANAIDVVEFDATVVLPTITPHIESPRRALGRRGSGH